jgi:hypothetical protein
LSSCGSALHRLRSRLHRPVDAASLGVFRIALGACLLLWVVQTFALGRIEAYYLEPTLHLTYPGFEWVRPWPGWGLHAHFAALGVCAVLIALGRWYRASCGLFALGFAYVFLLEQGRYLNHHYLVFLLVVLLALVPAHRAFSLEARRRGWRPEVSAWCVHLLRTQIGLVYLFAGVAKLNGDWLRGKPLSLWLPSHGDHPLLGSLVTQEWTAIVGSHGSLLLDLLAWPLLLWPATRLPAFFLVSAFHLTNATLFGIGVFPWLMIAASTLFFAPEWPRRWSRSTRAPGIAGARVVGRPALELCLAAYLALQLFLPLRHFLMPGRADWTEEGHRFSWRMLLRDKGAHVVLQVRDPASGALTLVDPHDELVSWQARKMSGNPDMIHAYALHLAQRWQAESGVRPEVRVETRCSLNGRPRQRLIDPAVDLAATPRSFWHSSWILPLEE